MTIFISILVILLTAGGQIFLKIGADKSENSGFINGFVLFGYVLFVISIILSYFLMKTMHLKYFVVIMSLNYIVVVISAKLFLSEGIKKGELMGAMLMSFGVVVFLLK